MTTECKVKSETTEPSAIRQKECPLSQQPYYKTMCSRDCAWFINDECVMYKIWQVLVSISTKLTRME